MCCFISLYHCRLFVDFYQNKETNKFKRRSKLQIRANDFSNRVVDVWNSLVSLPESVV